MAQRREVEAGVADRPARLGPRPLSLALATAIASGVEPGVATAFLNGVRAYWQHPYRRPRSLIPVLWRSGGVRLLDFAPGSDAPVVLVIPSLVNRSYILDLKPGHSLMAFLVAAGMRPLLLDWGMPAGPALSSRFEDVILGHAPRALALARELSPCQPVVLGYCMGGLLALALAVHKREALAGLALLATPWDFHAAGQRLGPAQALAPSTMIAGLGHAPVELLQGYFVGLDPAALVEKFRRFADLAPADPRAELFVAVEDWANDGVPLAGPIAQACLWEWYVENRPGRGRWQVGGVIIRPEKLAVPLLVAAPRRDRIVPPASSLALARLMPGATILQPASGHVGMVVGTAAEAQLWAPLAAWLRRTAAAARGGRALRGQGPTAKVARQRVTRGGDR